MPAEALLQKRTRDFSGVVRQQLRLHAMDAGRLLQGFDDVREQSFFDLVALRTATSVADRVADRLADEEIADNALILLIDMAISSSSSGRRSAEEKCRRSRISIRRKVRC